MGKSFNTTHLEDVVRNEKQAIATGTSSLTSESSKSTPIPGHEKIFSVITAPSTIVIIVKMNEVATGRSAVLAACLSLILV